MPSTVNVAIHASQFPEKVRRDLLASLRTRRVNHKFHYDSVKQAQKWLALHRQYSPSNTDVDCAEIYEQGFAAASGLLTGKKVQVIGLCCGDGRKDARLLSRLRRSGKNLSYAPCDGSLPMVLLARTAALKFISPEACQPLVCDLQTAEDLPATLAGLAQSKAPRLIAFFGTLHNFEPEFILAKLAAMLRPQDALLFSTNLAPGPDYAAGVRQILPQYDNAALHEWLLVFLLDLGVERGDGELRFAIETVPASGRQRVVARFHFTKARRIEIETDTIEFASGTFLRLFFSYRHTPERLRVALEPQGMTLCGQWITQSEEEGVFLCRKK